MVSLAAVCRRRSRGRSRGRSKVGVGARLRWTGRSGHLTGYNFIAENEASKKRKRRSEKAKDNMKDNIMRPDLVALPCPGRCLCPQLIGKRGGQKQLESK